MLRTDWLKIASIVCILFYLVGCSQVADPNVPNDATPSASEMTPMVPALPPQGDSTAMTPNLPTSAASGTERIIAMAKENLAQRLSIPITQINLVEIKEVEWSDSSLDCPQPGMSYLQVITPGYRILLEASETQYEYHSNRDAYVVYCDNANPPALPKP
jgi:hypothetical protein